jgi:putative membrane protein
LEPRVTIPYCGTPPAPGDLWSNWNLDPILIAALLVLVAAYRIGATRLRVNELDGWHQTSFYIGWLVLVAMLISPLCNLTVALFSARIGQHMVLTLIAAPLLVLGRPGLALKQIWPDLPVRGSAGRLLETGSLAGVAFTIFIWLWHVPGPYQATLESTAVYWAMHLTLLGSAIWLWHVILGAGASARLQGVVVCVASSLQMGLLGAIITLSPRALYASHALTTSPWGLTQMEDQQLGGLIMWVPGGMVFLVAALALAASALKRMEAEGRNDATAGEHQ